MIAGPEAEYPEPRQKSLLLDAMDDAEHMAHTTMRSEGTVDGGIGSPLNAKQCLLTTALWQMSFGGGRGATSAAAVRSRRGRERRGRG